MTPALPGLSPVSGKVLTARFDGGALSSDAGLMALRAVERRPGQADRLAACNDDPRDPARTPHSMQDCFLSGIVVLCGFPRVMP